MLEYLDTMKEMYKNAKNSILKIPEMEAKVLDATNSEAWGPSSTQMREIARATHSYANFPLIMDTIWRRIDDEARNWRHILKGLVLLDFLVKNGSEQVIREARVHLMQVQRLYDFSYIEGDKDYGLTIREKARQFSELINDDDRIQDEREKARVTAAKFSEAISSDTYHSGGGGYGGGGYGGRSGGGGGGGGDYGRDYDRGGRDYDRGGRDYGRRDEEPSYSRRRDDYHDDKPQPAPRGHIRAPSGGGSAPAPSAQPAKSAASVDFFNLMDEPAKPAVQPASTDFFAAFPAESASSSASSAPSAPANDFFAAGAPPTTTNQEPEWDEFAKADAPPAEDTKNPWANKKLFDLDNLTNPAGHSAATGKRPLGVPTTSPSRPLGSIPSTTPVSNTLGGGAPLGGGLGRPGYAPGVGVGVPAGYGMGVGAAPGMMVAAPGYGAAPGMMVAAPAGYGVGVGATPGYGVPMAYGGAPGMMMMAPAGYGVAPVGMAPGVGMPGGARPVQPGVGYPPR